MLYNHKKYRGDYLAKEKTNQEHNLKDMFVKEQYRLKNIIYDEIEHLKKHEATDIKCSLDMLKDAIFVIDRGFEDIVDGININNLKERERQLNIFKEGLIYAIYGR